MVHVKYMQGSKIRRHNALYMCVLRASSYVCALGITHKYSTYVDYNTYVINTFTIHVAKQDVITSTYLILTNYACTYIEYI